MPRCKIATNTAEQSDTCSRSRSDKLTWKPRDRISSKQSLQANSRHRKIKILFPHKLSPGDLYREHTFGLPIEYFRRCSRWGGARESGRLIEICHFSM
jgi:hypothetical protein